MQDGQKIGGKATIPVAEMAKASLEKIFPQLTPAQVKALRDGTPVPPSSDWVNTVAPVNSERIKTIEKDLEDSRKVLQTTVRRSELFDATMAAGKATLSAVTAILVFSDPTRVRRARKAVNQFVAQSHPNKHLIIVNTTDMPITNVEHPAIRELQHTPAAVGALRNVALQKVSTPLVFPFWDDDDVYDPDLLSYLTLASQPLYATMLTTQIRLDIQNSVAYMHTDKKGIPNTILYPHDREMFAEVTGREDEDFYRRYWQDFSIVVDNAAWPVNTLLMRVYDGHNVLDAESFMAGHATPEHHGRWELDAKVVTHVINTMEPFGLKVQADVPKEASQPVTA